MVVNIRGKSLILALENDILWRSIQGCTYFKTYLYLNNIAGSYNGSMIASEAIHLGSNPSPAADNS